MPRAGQVRVVLSKAEAMAAANWLLTQYAPPPSTRLMSYSKEQRDAKFAIAKKLGNIFLKFARRSSSIGHNRVALFERRDVAWFKEIIEALVLGGLGKGYCMAADTESGSIFAGPLEMDAFSKCYAAARRARGNNRISRSDLEARVSRQILVEPRHQKRLARRQRHDRAIAQWRANGGTLLTGPDMPVF